MRRLWVDVDDTLIKWLGDREWEWNLELCDGIRKYLRFYPDTELVIWSGGGTEYAQTWASRFNSIWRIEATIEPKFVTQPDDNDVVVDDMPLNVSCLQFTPDEFVKWITPECLCWIKFRGSTPLTNDNMVVNSSKGFRI